MEEIRGHEVYWWMKSKAMKFIIDYIMDDTIYII